MIVLRSVLKSAMDAGYLATLPTLGIRPLKAVSKKRPTFTPANFEELLAACVAKKKDGEPVTKNGAQLVDYLRFLAYSGARCNEALLVKWADVDYPGKLLCIGSDGASKNSKARHVDFNPDLEGILSDMQSRRAPDTEWLFPSPQRGEADRPAKSLRESLKLARKEAKLEWVGFHDLRHYFASRAVMAGIDFKTIAEWMGHQDGGVLLCKVYSHLLDGHKHSMGLRFICVNSVDGSLKFFATLGVSVRVQQWTDHRHG